MSIFKVVFAQEKLISIHKDAANLLLKPSAATVVVVVGLADRRAAAAPPDCSREARASMLQVLKFF